MKRILVAMLIISMTAGMTLQNVKASDEEVYYSESQIESIAQNYTEKIGRASCRERVSTFV